MENEKDIPKNDNYKVPNDYFIDFQERLQVQIEFEEMVGIKKETGFIVPDKYFSNLPEKINQKTQQPVKVISLFKKKWIYTAASVAAIMMLLVTLNPFSTSTGIDALENDTIAAYLETNNYIISDYELSELLTDDELEGLSDNIQLEDTEVLEYLDITTDPYDLMIQ